MNVYLVIAGYGYDGGDDIEGAFGTPEDALTKLWALAAELKYTVEHTDNPLTTQAVGKSLGWHIRIEEWEVQ